MFDVYTICTVKLLTQSEAGTHQGQLQDSPSLLSPVPFPISCPKPTEDAAVEAVSLAGG